VWHSKDIAIKIEEDNHVNASVQDELNSDADTGQFIEEATSLFETMDKALVNVRMQRGIYNKNNKNKVVDFLFQQHCDSSLSHCGMPTHK